MGIQETCHTSQDTKVPILAQPENMGGMECMCGTADVAKDHVGVTWDMRTHSTPAPGGAQL